jgi:uncharacterized protein YprB with RNaseH-like and TPR domain
MPRPFVRTLLKTAKGRRHLQWLEEHRCKHRSSYLLHYNCYLAEQPGNAIPERIGFLDIESSNLKADFGICLAWCIKPSDSKKIISRSITPTELKTCLDRNVVRDCITEMLKFDRIVGHYSSKFDIPFLRSRALFHGLDFPEYRKLWQTDTWRIARERLCISSNRLDNIARQLHIAEEKTRITPDHWIGALTGGKKHLKYILDHCKIDVLVLEKVWYALEKFANKAKTST